MPTTYKHTIADNLKAAISIGRISNIISDKRIVFRNIII
ncbi:MAG: hypothetical protein K2J47_09425 [Ruminococcus sp.]|nr:hypothetical protein [Ruminococcus sp.]